jgi:hypothetical protein
MENIVKYLLELREKIMNKARHARGFKDLLVYRKAQEVAIRIFEISKNFPKEEGYSLTDQIRRATRSIGAQIAEAWGNRVMKNILSAN